MTLFVLSGVNFWSQANGSGYDDGKMFAVLFIVGVALMTAVWAAIPVFAIWVPLFGILKSMKLSQRLAAVLAAGPAAGLGAIISEKLYLQMTREFADKASLGLQEIAVIVITAMLITHLIWTVIPQRVEPV